MGYLSFNRPNGKPEEPKRETQKETTPKPRKTQKRSTKKGEND